MTSFANTYGFSAGQLQSLLDSTLDLIEGADFSGASVLLSGLLVLEPRNARVLALHGAVHHAQGRFDDALGAYDLALEIEPTTALALVNRGELLCERGELMRGREDLRAAVRLKSNVRIRAEALLRKFSASS